MMAIETIFVHKARNPQLLVSGSKPVYYEVCNRTVRPDETREVDNSPSPFAG